MYPFSFSQSTLSLASACSSASSSGSEYDDCSSQVGSPSGSSDGSSGSAGVSLSSLKNADHHRSIGQIHHWQRAWHSLQEQYVWSPSEESRFGNGLPLFFTPSNSL